MGRASTCLTLNSRAPCRTLIGQVGGRALPYYLSSYNIFCASPLLNNEFPTLNKSMSIFASFTLLFNNLCF